MIRVQVRQNEPLEAALRRFKRQCNYAGIFRLAKKYAYHEKRSDKRRREERERVRAIQRAERKQDGTPYRGRKKKVRSSSVIPRNAGATAEVEDVFEDTTVVGAVQAAAEEEAAPPRRAECCPAIPASPRAT